MGCKQKHVFKRSKEQIKGEIGITIYNYKFTGSFLQDMLLFIGTPKDKMKDMFNIGFADAMSVLAMDNLYRSVADMAQHDPKDFGEAVKDKLKFFSLFCDLIWTVLCDKAKKLEGHLENIASRQHIVCSVYWSVTNAIEDGVSEHFLFQDSGDILEEAYGLLRCLAGGATGNDSVMAVLQCTERISGVMVVQGAHARNPHMCKGPRYLVSSVDHMNPKTFLSDNKGGVDLH
eukprot:15366785-Ditylum_brightwellii.AAC.1